VNEWFRLDVPIRLRGLVGKTAWKQSLHTSDKRLAAVKRAELTSFYKAEIIRLDGVLGALEADDARELVDRALEILAARKGSYDAVVLGILIFMTLRARQSWGRDHEREANWDFGAFFHGALDDGESALRDPAPMPGFDTDPERQAFVLRQRLIERRGLADGITFQEVAQRLLERQAWAYVEVDLLGLLQVVGIELKAGTPKFDAAAEHLLRRLSEHQFGDWRPHVREAIAPMAAAAVLPQMVLPVPAPSSAAIHPRAGKGHPILDVFSDWRAHSKASEKTKDEFERCVSRFVAQYGDMPVELITKKMTIDWKRLLTRLPAQPKTDVARLTPEEQAERAEADGLRRLSGATATKYLQALRSVLTHARDEMLIISGDLPTRGVSIEIDDDEAVEVLPFTEEQMALIFSQPEMTDADAGDDEIFWFVLMAPFTGCRLEETAQLRPANIRAEKNVSFIAIERDRIAERRKIAEEGGIRKRFKAKLTTRRNIPVHWLLKEAGFLELASFMSERGADWLFEGLREIEKYDQRSKYMSNKLMRFLRRIGIKDRENVYHSFRHSLKRELRDDERTKEEISDLLTGHSFAESVGRRYARGAGLMTLEAAVNRVEYGAVEWDSVVASGRARVERMIRRAST
jgi:integrase